jgi:septal ring factor EnvC (AmiA/AmiB activator)
MASNKELQDQLDAALAENKDLAQKIAALQSSNDLLTEEKAALMATLEDVSKGRDELASQNASLQAEVARLMETPDDKEAKAGTGEKFELNGEEYVLLVPNYNIPGFGHMSANDVLANPAAQAVLVANGSSLIKALK